MSILFRQSIVLLLFVLQAITPLLHGHNAVLAHGHAGIHLPMLDAVDPHPGGPELQQTQAPLKTFVVADNLKRPYDGSAPPSQLVASVPVTVAVSVPAWVPALAPRSVSPRDCYLIPYSCAPPRA